MLLDIDMVDGKEYKIHLVQRDWILILQYETQNSYDVARRLKIDMNTETISVNGGNTSKRNYMYASQM